MRRCVLQAVCRLPCHVSCCACYRVDRHAAQCVHMAKVSALNNKKGSTMGSVITEMGWTQLFMRGLGLRIAMIGTLTGELKAGSCMLGCYVCADHACCAGAQW